MITKGAQERGLAAWRLDLAGVAGGQLQRELQRRQPPFVSELKQAT